jgi:hypothetical protein
MVQSGGLNKHEPRDAVIISSLFAKFPDKLLIFKDINMTAIQ